MSRIGEIIDGYRLVNRIGSGGTAIVYLGEHLEDPSQLVAIKMLKTDIEDELT